MKNASRCARGRGAIGNDRRIRNVQRRRLATDGKTTRRAGRQSYSLIGTCELSGINPEAYLCRAFTHIADHRLSRVETKTESVDRAEQHVDCGLSGDFGYQVGPSFSEGAIA
ncbi:transposase domain-containing protein [Caballeronia ptereochthonis]|uniref:transposase domain-containing protein n=1 Tax=Caballeronia ptereochthonis TaxID=1777144 RepID=UPI000B35BD7E